VLRNTAADWGGIAKLFHWTMAALIFTQFALGWMAASWRLSPTKLDLFIWHKSIGMLILLLVTLRLLWRLANATPILPAATPTWERYAAHASHIGLYAAMLAMPVTGWIINSASKIPFRVFWWFPLPAIVAPDKAVAELAKQAHFLLFIVLAVLLVVHIAAAWRHHTIKRTDVLTRMLPHWRMTS
jgi:cytochrome b561